MKGKITAIIYLCYLSVVSLSSMREAQKEVIKVNNTQKQAKARSKPDVVQISAELPYTETEIRIARLSVEGLSDKEIAGVFHITPDAVRALKEIITAKARAINRGC